MKIILFGGSGFLGKPLIPMLLASGHNVSLVTRRPEQLRNEFPQSVEIVPWSSRQGLAPAIEGSDAIINLSGESIGAKRWSAKRKAAILSSRIDTTRAIVDAIGKTSKRPSVFLNASAVGYYGNVDNDEVTESYRPGNDFLADVCIRWENEARKAEQFGVRVVLP
ncbi:MAG TPA: NAD-dependent epimerase/dehydratase family protein, partial [Bacteroidota bacterium]